MLTALQIEEYAGGSFWHFFRRNRVRVGHRYCDSAAVKSVVYEHYRGKLNWTTIDRFVKGQRDRLLCPESVELPASLGYRRFESSELNRRMCGNAALYLLRMAERRDIKTVLVDREGECLDLCERLTDYTEPVYVVTESPELYAAEAEYLLSEKGAILRVSRSAGCLRDADVIINPRCISDDLCCQPTAVLLSGEKPAYPQLLPVIYDYTFELPQKYRDVMPPYLDEMYFASALYALAHARGLSAELFTRCGDGTVIHTRQSLVEMLKKRLSVAGDFS